MAPSGTVRKGSHASRPPVRFYGFNFLGAMSILGAPVVQAAGTTATWDGSSGTDWATGTNWSTNVAPTAADGVVVSATGKPIPTISSGAAYAKDLTISSGLTVNQTGGTFYFYHDWKNSGTFNGTGGTFIVAGTAGGGATWIAGTNQFYNFQINAGFDPGFDNDANGSILIGGNFTDYNTVALGVAAAYTITFNGSGAQTITTSRGANNSFYHLAVNKAAGAVTLANALKVVGNLTITAGTLDLATYTMTGGVVTLKSGSITSSTGVLTGSSYAVESGNISAILAGAAAMTKTTTGTVTLSGVNTFTGITTLTGGILSVGTIGNGAVAGNLGQATAAATNLVFNGGTLQYTGASASTNRNFTINAGKVATIDVTANNLTISGASTNTTGLLTKTGAGTLTLSGTNLHTGLTTITAGTLAISSANNLSGTSGIDFAGSGSTLYATANGITLNKLISQTSAGRYLIDTGNTMTLSGVISGAGQFQKEGDGTIILNNTNSYSGKTVVNAGTLQLGTSGSINNANMDIVGGTYDLNGHNQSLSGTLTLGASDGSTAGTLLSGSGTLTVNGSMAFRNGSVSAKLAGTAGLTKSTSATVTLTGTNTYSGTTTVSDGKLTVGSSGSIASTSGVTIAGGEFNYNSATTLPALSGGVAFSGTGGILSGTGMLTPAVIVTAGNSYTPGEMGGTGTQSLANGMTFNSGSIFAWDLDVTSSTTELHDSVGANSLAGSGAEFKILLGSGDSYATAFWDSSRTWTAADLFGASNANVNLSSIFSSSNTTTNFNPNPSQGYFSFTNSGGYTGNNLHWTAVPEPGSALAGLLLGAGLLRRRRH